MSDADKAKRAAAEAALEFVKPGMKLGLGTGSTAAIFIDLLAERNRSEDLGLRCVPTSLATQRQAAQAGLQIADLNDLEWLDLTIDGADEIDPDLRLIKGGGGALLIEKIVAAASDEMLVIADRSKMVEELGAFPLPVEIVRFGWRAAMLQIQEALEEFDVDGLSSALRMTGGEPYVTDEGHYILDLALGRIGEPEDLAEFLNTLPGVVETGLFIDLAARAIIGSPNGDVHVIDAPEPEELEDLDEES